MSLIRDLDLLLPSVSQVTWQEQVTRCFDAPDIRPNTRFGNPGLDTVFNTRITRFHERLLAMHVMHSEVLIS